MIHTLVRRTTPGLYIGLLALTASCDKELDDNYTLVGERFPTVVSNTTPFPIATKFAAGETVTVELNFTQQTDPIKEILVLQKVEPSRDSTIVQTIPYQPAYSKTKNADTLLINYVVPAAANKALIRLDTRVVSTNGQFKTRSASFRVAEATPTISLNAATNITAPGTTTPVPGDVVRIPVVLNTGGITSATAITAAGTLYKDIDSLVTYVKIGTANERRFARQRVPTAGTQTGAAATVNVDLTLPTGSSGQPVVFRFEAKSRYQSVAPRPVTAPTNFIYRTATATAPTITPGIPTALAAARTVTLTYTGTTGGDLAAYDLTTFAAVPFASAPATKDAAVTSTASNAVRLQALNTSRFLVSTAAAYNVATLNSIRQAYLTAASNAQLTTIDNVTVGSVYITRLRGADQYAIFTVTGINRTSATDVAVTLAVKAL
jgi:hypothetical protein